MSDYQRDWTFNDLHPDVRKAMKAIRDQDWDTLHEITGGAAFQKIIEAGYTCTRCEDRGWFSVSHTDTTTGEIRAENVACPDCEKGREMGYNRWQGRIRAAEIPAQYQRFTFETWISELADNDRIGKQAAHMAAIRFCDNLGHMVDLHEIFDILGAEWEDWRDARPKNSIVFYGDYGTGKTGLAISAVNYLVERGVTALYIRCRDLVREVQSRYGKQESPSADEVLRRFQRVPVLMIDEFNIDNLTPDRLEIIEDVMRYRYGNQLPTLMTCNIDQDTFRQQWGGRTGDVVIAMAHWILVGGAKLRRTDGEVIEVYDWQRRKDLR